MRIRHITTQAESEGQEGQKQRKQVHDSCFEEDNENGFVPTLDLPMSEKVYMQII